MRRSRIPRLLVAALVCALAVSLFALPALAAADETQGETLVVGVPSDRSPLFYIDPETNEPDGIGVAIMRFIAQDAGYDVVFKPIGSDMPKDALVSGGYDVTMPFSSITGSNADQALVVSDNLMQMPFTLVTVGDRSLPSLNSLKIGMQKTLGSTAESIRQLYPGVEIVTYDTMEEAVGSLRQGRVDALLHNSYAWSYLMQKPAYSDLKVQPSAMFSMDFRAGVQDTPRGREIIERLNGSVGAVSNTHLQEIVLDYTGKQLYRYDVLDYLYMYGVIFALGILLISALVVIIVQRKRTMKLKQEERMRQLIDHDALTGMYSLEGFRKRVESLLREHPEVPYTLSYNNIENFKYINDRFGKQAGDDLLRFWANRCVSALSHDEAIGRISSDHFVMLRRFGGDIGMNRFEEKVIFPLRKYFVDRGEEALVQVSTGVYVLELEDYQHIDVDHMLDCARVAERKQRETHTAGYAFYNPEQWERGRLSADIVSRLPLALESGEIRVWYQPQMNFETGEITGMEALCRWNHGTLGWLSPAVFIPILEESGHVYELDFFVWEQVCKDLHRWNERGWHTPVSVNLSRSDIRKDHDVCEHFQTLLQTYSLPTDLLRVEVTETAFAEDPDLLIGTTERLRELGFAVEMDDFGSGYSSLHMLKEVPVDRIKLDLHFLTGTGDLEKGRIIVSQMISLVRMLGMELIVEGVETIEQAHFLQEQGCFEMQGFYFHKPMPVEDVESVLQGAHD